MSDKKFNARIQHKIDIQENWEKATNFIPLKGEWIFYDKDANNENIRLKIGDGTTLVNDLEFISLSSNTDSFDKEISWDDLIDKPFGTENVNLTFSGNISDYLSAESQIVGALGIPLKVYRISENYYASPEETYGAEIGLTVNGTDMSFTVEDSDITEFDNGFMAQRGPENGWYPLYVNITSPGETIIDTTELFEENLIFNFTDPGLYLFYVEGMLVANYFKGIQIKKLDKEYIPSEIGTWSNMSDKPFGDETLLIEIPSDVSNLDQISSQGIEGLDNLSFSYVKVSDNYFKNPEETYGALVKVNNGETDLEFTVDQSQVHSLENGFVLLDTSQGFYPFLMNITAAGTATIPSEEFIGENLVFSVNNPGIYFLYMEAINAKTVSYQNKKIKQIDLKYVDMSWDNLTNKPFYEDGISINWNLQPTDTFVQLGDDTGFYKMTDTILSKEDLIGANFKAKMDDTSIDQTLTANDIYDYNEYCYGFKETPYFLITTQATEVNILEMPLSFPSAGIWFVSSGTVTYTYHLSQGNGIIKQIDPKFIPNAFYEIGSKIEWDGTPTSVYETFDVGGGALGYFYKVAEPVDTIINGTVYTIQTDGEGEDSLGSDVVQVTNGGENGMYIMNVKVPNSVFTHPAGVDITFREVGLYFFYANINGQEVKITSFTSSNYSIKQIDKKFIPDDIVASVSLTFDEVPTEGSQNPVKSMGIHSAISALEGKITSTFCYKGTVDNYSDLPTENNTVGDVWNIINADETNGINAGDNAAWNGTGWDILAGVIDLSNYYTKTEIDSIALNGNINLTNYYTKAETDELIANIDAGGGGNGNIDLSNYYTKSESDSNLASSLATKADLVDGKVPLAQLPDDIGGGIITDCPTYTGGYINDTSDLNNLIVINYYKLLASMTADYKFDMNEALYDINSDHFTITFQPSSIITSDNNITIKIATGYSGSADSMDINSFTSNLHIELQSTRELKKSWYTAYCLYNEASDKWSGYLISAASDTSSLESNINSIQNQVWNKQDISDRVTSISSSSKDYQYPSAKLLYDIKTELNNTINTKQDKSNLVTNVDSNSTNEQYPSAKLLYDINTELNNTKQDKSNLVTSIDENSTHEQYPSAKLLYNIVGDCDVVLDEISALIGE